MMLMKILTETDYSILWIVRDQPDQPDQKDLRVQWDQWEWKDHRE